MASTSPPNDLARQFLELWQSQFATMAKDPEISGKMADNLRVMQQSYLTWMQNYAPQQPQPGPAVPGDGIAAPAELERRLAECEARLAALERQLEKQGRSAA